MRALHVLLDAPPHGLTDEIGLRLADPGDGWEQRPDMDPVRTAGLRAAMVARTRFVEDLVTEAGVAQYVLLGAGLDTCVQRRAVPGVTVFEVDRPETQAWKRGRLSELGLSAPRFVPVDFDPAEDRGPETRLGLGVVAVQDHLGDAARP